MQKLAGKQPNSEPIGTSGARLHQPISGTLGTEAESTRLADVVREAALRLGFVRAGFCGVEAFDSDRKRLAEWIAGGRHGAMNYLADGDRADPRALLPEAKTLIVVALPYTNADAVPLRASAGGPALTGSIARYARGNDYHDVMRSKLRRLADAVANAVGRPVRARHCVDTAPLLERAAAERAGIGFAAKSTLTIVPGVGSYVLLGELLVDVTIEPDRAQAPRCGSCRLCLDACPTGAFVGPHLLDATRCISYLTIELTGPIPRELRALIGTRVFGCDVCQDVCPFNASRAERSGVPELAARPELARPDLVALLELGSAGYRRFVKGSALRRAHRAQLSRNAAVALGNSGDPRAVLPLVRAVAAHPIALVRGHAAWALGELGALAKTLAQPALECAAAHDPDVWVREEANAALARLSATPSVSVNESSDRSHAAVP